MILKEYIIVLFNDYSEPSLFTKEGYEGYLTIGAPRPHKIITTFNKDDELTYTMSAGTWQDEHLSDVTEIMREADLKFAGIGGGTRHYLRGLLFPMLHEKGFAICRAAPPAGDGWISVEDGLPETDNEVQAYFECDKMIAQAYFNQRNKIWYGSANVRSQMREGDCEDAELRAEKITHWRPLSTPPKTSV